MKYYNDDTFNDRWIIEDVFKGKHHGFFIEAGAVMGKWGSSTYLLEIDFDWKGILIEPANHHFDKLKEYRPNSIHINKCLYNKDGEEIEFKELGEEERGSNTIKEFWTDDMLGHCTNKDSYKIVKKETITLEKVLDDNHAPKVIDYLSLDIEGAEESVIGCFPFDKYIFKAVSIEMPNCNNILEQHGYVQVTNPYTTVDWDNNFIHESCISDFRQNRMS